MNKNLKIFLSIMAGLFIAGASLAYGAMTAPGKQTVTHTPTPKQSVNSKPSKEKLVEMLHLEQSIITGVMTTAYPKITTDYTINQGQLFDEGQWYGTTLTYRGKDNDNRDTLRVLMQKKNGTWRLLTTPPRLLLTVKDFPDVPKSILQSINKPVSLPSSTSSPAPTVSATE